MGIAVAASQGPARMLFRFVYSCFKRRVIMVMTTLVCIVSCLKPTASLLSPEASPTEVLTWRKVARNRLGFPVDKSREYYESFITKEFGRAVIKNHSHLLNMPVDLETRMS